MVAAHNKIIFQGTLLQSSGGGSEIFDFSMADMSSLTPTALATLADPIMATAWGTPANSIQASSVARYQGCRVEHIDTTGKVTSSYYKATATPTLGLNTSMSSTITCQAVSLETGQYDSKGRLIRGRFYPPAQATSVQGATFSLTDTTTYNTAWAAVLHALNQGGAAIAVSSSTSVGLVAVTGTSCDTVQDTQRRRKNGVTSQRTAIHTI
jgi:hypothetical protein